MKNSLLIEGHRVYGSPKFAAVFLANVYHLVAFSLLSSALAFFCEVPDILSWPLPLYVKPSSALSQVLRALPLRPLPYRPFVFIFSRFCGMVPALRSPHHRPQSFSQRNDTSASRSPPPPPKPRLSRLWPREVLCIQLRISPPSKTQPKYHSQHSEWLPQTLGL
jgi:hypothetical protein